MKNCVQSMDVVPVVASMTDHTWQPASAWKGLTGTAVDSEGTWR